MYYAYRIVFESIRLVLIWLVKQSNFVHGHLLITRISKYVKTLVITKIINSRSFWQEWFLWLYEALWFRHCVNVFRLARYTHLVQRNICQILVCGDMKVGKLCNMWYLWKYECSEKILDCYTDGMLIFESCVVHSKINNLSSIECGRTRTVTSFYFTIGSIFNLIFHNLYAKTF